MDSFLNYCGGIAGFVFANVLTILKHRRHPPFMEKGEGGKIYPVCEWFWGVAFLSVYMGMTGNARDSILKDSKMLIPYLILFLAFLDIWVVVNNASIVARIFFYKYMKKHKNG